MSNIKKCPYCNSIMKNRGASDSSGGYSFKCKNKKCGRTMWFRRIVTPPIPVTSVYSGHSKSFYGRSV